MPGAKFCAHHILRSLARYVYVRTCLEPELKRQTPSCASIRAEKCSQTVRRDGREFAKLAKTYMYANENLYVQFVQCIGANSFIHLASLFVSHSDILFFLSHSLHSFLLCVGRQ